MTDKPLSALAPSWRLSPLRRWASLRFSPVIAEIMTLAHQARSPTAAATIAGSMMFSIDFSCGSCKTPDSPRSTSKALDRRIDHAALKQIGGQANPAVLNSLGALGPDARCDKAAGLMSFAVHARAFKDK